MNDGAEASTVAVNELDGNTLPMTAKSVLLAPLGTRVTLVENRNAGLNCGLVVRVNFTVPLNPFIELKITEPIPSDPVVR